MLIFPNKILACMVLAGALRVCKVLIAGKERSRREESFFIGQY